MKDMLETMMWVNFNCNLKGHFVFLTWFKSMR